MTTPDPKITAIVPALNEAPGIIQTLDRLRSFRKSGHEVIVVDGGSCDDTVALSRPLADKVFTATRGRASQMNAGANVANGDILWFLHADCLPPIAVDQLIANALKQKDAAWGRFNVRLSGSGILYRTVEFMMNLRSRATSVATGDQGIFVTRNAFTQVGGFPDIPLMEDVAVSKRLRSLGRPVCLHQELTTSSRRWEEYGAWRTILMMWRLRLAYVLGASPETLARLYR